MKGIVWSTKRPLPAFPFIKCPTVPCGMVAQLCYSVFFCYGMTYCLYHVVRLFIFRIVHLFALSVNQLSGDNAISLCCHCVSANIAPSKTEARS